MKLVVSIIISCFCFFIPIQKTQASHIMGGEITWKCDPSGKYIFKVTFYRDCSGVSLAPRGDLKVHNYPLPGLDTIITLNRIDSNELVPHCRGGSLYSCANGDPEAVFEHILQSAPISLNGVPPANTGWIMTFGDILRNLSNNLVPSSGITLRSKMFNYPGRTSSCIDNSPFSASLPVTLNCVGKPFGYNSNTVDFEYDSLAYSWAKPINSLTGLYVEGVNPSPIVFQTGYSYNSPFPGVLQNSMNVPVVLDTNTGEISFTSHTVGKYASAIKTSAHKCGDVVAEIYSELQFNISANCQVNMVPNFLPPFSSTTGIQRYYDTVYAGALVQLNVMTLDPPVSGSLVFDTVYLEASGIQFGNNFTSSTVGCPNPPCATLSNTPPLSALLGVSTSFRWRTSVAHLATNDSCTSLSNTHTFVFLAKDDVCPIPAQRVATLAITVMDSSLIPIITSIQDSGYYQRIQVFPNPSSKEFNISLNEQYKSGTVIIRNINGQIVNTENYIAKETLELSIDGSSGIYFIQLLNNRGEETSLKVVKQ